LDMTSVLSELLPACLDCWTPFLRHSRRCSCGSTQPPGFGPRDFVVGMSPKDEYSAAELLFYLRFGGDWTCACGHRRCTHLRTRPRLFECNACGRTISVTAGTSLHGCRVPLMKVAEAARLLSIPDGSISARSLARRLGVCVETAWSLAHRLRIGFLDQESEVK